MRLLDPSRRDEPEINLIPFIDVLLVILIFLMMTSVYSRPQALDLQLPSASEAAQSQQAQQITLAVAQDGRYGVNGRVLAREADLETLSQQLALEAGGRTEITLAIEADAAATHQMVVKAMEAGRRAGLYRIAFITQAQRAAQEERIDTAPPAPAPAAATVPAAAPAH